MSLSGQELADASPAALRRTRTPRALHPLPPLPTRLTQNTQTGILDAKTFSTQRKRPHTVPAGGIDGIANRGRDGRERRLARTRRREIGFDKIGIDVRCVRYAQLFVVAEIPLRDAAAFECYFERHHGAQTVA